jgi:hypothetical protein
MATVNHERNLGYFEGFMKGYGRADYPTRAQLYMDTQAYSYGAETGETLLEQVSQLLGVGVPSSQPFVSPLSGMAA